jgi:hypothetical protein
MPTNPQFVSVTLPLENGPYTEGLTDSVVASTGSSDAGKLPLTGTGGKLDPSLLPIPAPQFGSGSPVGVVNGVEGGLYFDTSASPFNGWVFHSGTWAEFQ